MKKIILLILLAFSLQTIFAQTPYQTKCHQIFTKYIKLFAAGTGTRLNAGDSFAYSAMGYDESALTILEPMLLSYCMSTGKNYDTMLKQMRAEYTAARKLMNSQEKLAIKIYEEQKTPYGKIKWAAANDFNIWMKKGQYETTVDLETRLKEQSVSVFDQIVYNTINEIVFNDYWFMDIGDYDADGESLELRFHHKEHQYKLSYWVKMSAPNAKFLKEKCYTIHNEPNDKTFFGHSYITSDWPSKRMMKFYYDTDELCFLNNEIIIPRYFQIESEYGNWTIDNTSDGYSGIDIIKYRFDDMAIDNPYLKGHVFDSEQYAVIVKTIRQENRRKAEAQKARQDSIEIAKYNAFLHEEWDRANNEVTSNKFNINGYSLKDEYKITVNNKDAYMQMSSKISEDKEKIVDKIKTEYNTAWHDYWHLYGNNAYSATFDSYYCQGAKVFAAETERRLVMKELEKSHNSIMQIDFKKNKSNASFSNIVAVATGEQTVDYSQINDERTKIMTWVAQYEQKPYYEEIIAYLIKCNSGLNTEYAKNGQKFSSAGEFYKAFTSDNYKAILKSKK